MNNKRLIIGFVFLIIVFSLWYFAIVPEFEKMPGDFHYNAEVISIDNFYNGELQNFSGPIFSETEYSIETVFIEGKILELKVIFDVRKLNGEEIFKVKRIYGVDRYNGKHVLGYGDKNRSGYLFAPRNLKKDDFIYWHINYNAPATMKYQNEEFINGLKVYRYESNYTSDPTESLTHLQGVPEKKGIGNDINLQLWIEPITGKMIKYEDKTLAYFYDINTKEHLNPWNKFNNKLTEDTITTQVIKAQNEKFKYILIRTIIPILLALTIIVITLVLSLKKEENKR